MLIFGYVKLFKSLSLSYKNNDLRVYLHLLISANYENKEFKGVKLAPGQLITSYQSISSNLSLSLSAVRIAVNHLIDLDLVQWSGLPPRFSICTIKNYKMQTDNKTYNYTKLYRNIQAYNWYTDDIASKLYYYILLHYGSNGCSYHPIDVQIDLGIDRKQYVNAIDKLVKSEAVKIEIKNRGKDVIATLAGDSIDKKADDKVEGEVEKKTDDKEKTEKIKDKDVCVDLDDILML